VLLFVVVVGGQTNWQRAPSKSPCVTNTSLPVPAEYAAGIGSRYCSSRSRLRSVGPTNGSLLFSSLQLCQNSSVVRFLRGISSVSLCTPLGSLSASWLSQEANQRRQGRRQNQNQNQDQDPEEMGMGMGMTSSAVVSAGATSASAAGASSSNDPRPPLTAQSWAKW